MPVKTTNQIKKGNKMNSIILQTPQGIALHPLGERMRESDWRRSGVLRAAFGAPIPENSIRAVSLQEFRPPKRGEWFLAGSVPEAYRWSKKRDGDTRRRIVRLVRVKTEIKSVTRIIW
jgi:hypothetical protein